MNLKSTLCIGLPFETRRIKSTYAFNWKWIWKWLFKQSLRLLPIKFEIVGISYPFLPFFSAWKCLEPRTHTFLFIELFGIQNAERRGFREFGLCNFSKILSYWDQNLLTEAIHEFPQKNIFFSENFIKFVYINIQAFPSGRR